MDDFKNFSYTVVSEAPSPAASGTSLKVTDASVFPATPFNATVWPSGVNPLASNAEIVRVTNIAGSTLTIDREQESTGARTILLGDQIAAAVTQKFFDDLETALAAAGGDPAATTHAATAKTTPADNDELPLVDSAASYALKKLTWARVKATLKTYFDGIYSTFDGAYSSLSGVPSTFSPSAHTHPQSDITNLTSDLAGKLGATATAADVNPAGTSIAAALSGKLGTSAQAADVNPAGTSIAVALSGKLGTSAQAADVDPAGTSIAAALAGKAASSHSHAGSDITSGTVDPARLGSGSSITTKFLRGDSTWQTISGGGDALTSGNLSQFAATTSAQLAGVISDENGSGKLIFSDGTLAVASGKTLTASNTVTLTATDGSTLAIGTGGTLGTAAYTASTAYTSSSVVPSTAPSAGQLLVGNAGGTAYAAVSASGDATVASTGAVTIANDAVSNAKLANMAASAIKARKTGSTGDPEDCTLSEVLDLVGSAAQGDILYRGASTWTRLAAGTADYYLQTKGSGQNPVWAAVSATGGGTKTYSFFTPLDNQPPAANFATLDTRNAVAVLDFDDGATNEESVFVGVIPEAASLGSGLKVRIFWAATSATSGNCRWGVQFEKYGTDIDSDSFDTATEAHTAASGTSGIVVVTEITATSIDSLAAGDQYRIKVYRDSSDTTNDTMTGDAELVAVEVRSAA